MGRCAIEKLWPELGLEPGSDSIPPHNISKSDFPFLVKFINVLNKEIVNYVIWLVN